MRGWAGAVGRSVRQAVSASELPAPAPRPMRGGSVVFAALTLLALVGAAAQLRAWAVPAWLIALLAPLQTLPLLWARQAPLAAWRPTALGLAVSTSLGYGQGELRWPWPAATVLVMLLVLVTVAATVPRPVVLAVGALTGLFVVLPAAWTVALPPGVVLVALGAVAAALLVGDNVRVRRQVQRELQRQLARHAVLEERSRIARELHDVVAHHMSLIAIQAEAAPISVPDLPDPARETFATIRGTARVALGELRRLVGLLRDETEQAERLPQPGLARVAELTDSARQAGVQVVLRITGPTRPLPPGVVIDAFSRLVVGHSIADHLRAELVVDALELRLKRTQGCYYELTDFRLTVPGLAAASSRSNSAAFRGSRRGCGR